MASKVSHSDCCFILTVLAVVTHTLRSQTSHLLFLASPSPRGSYLSHEPSNYRLKVYVVVVRNKLTTGLDVSNRKPSPAEVHRVHRVCRSEEPVVSSRMRETIPLQADVSVLRAVDAVSFSSPAMAQYPSLRDRQKSKSSGK